jgi:hypothetical protein
MHEEEVKGAVEKVLTADDIIHKHLFGWDWRGPKLDLIYSPDLLNEMPGAELPAADEDEEEKGEGGLSPGGEGGR